MPEYPIPFVHSEMSRSVRVEGRSRTHLDNERQKDTKGGHGQSSENVEDHRYHFPPVRYGIFDVTFGHSAIHGHLALHVSLDVFTKVNGHSMFTVVAFGLR